MNESQEAVEFTGIIKDEVFVNLSDMMKHLVLTVTIKRRRIDRFRLWLGLVFVQFGAWIVGLGGVNIKDAEAEIRDTRPMQSVGSPLED